MFGKGSYEGNIASETANNAAVSGAMAPLLALGIPGSATTAVLIGALMIQGIQPGPLLFTRNPEIPYSIFASLFIGVPVMIVIGLAGARLWAQVANIPRPAIAAIVATICLIGAYASDNSIFPVFIMTAFGIIGYILRKARIPLAPIVLALVLGDMMETNFRRAMVISRGSYDIFYTHPLTLILLVGAVLAFVVPLLNDVRSKRRTSAA